MVPNGVVLYRNDQFFVVAKPLTDGSTAHEVWVNNDTGEETVQLFTAYSRQAAVAACNAMHNAVRDAV